MHPGPGIRMENEPPPRFPFDRGRILWRGIALVFVLVAIAWICDAPWSVTGLMTSAALLAGMLERVLLRGEIGSVLQRTSRASRAEGERDALAKVMSLELAHERARSVLEALREGVLVVDGSGEIVLANPAARRALRSPALDPGGSLLWDALMPELAQRAKEAWAALRETPGSITELPQIRYSAIPCRDSVYDLTAVQVTSQRTGHDFGTVFLLVDSTRTHELQRLKDRFLSSVSHELRTPLTNVCAYSEILGSLVPGESAEWPEFVRIIHEEGLQLSRLVDGMFDFLQLESGEAPFASDVLDGAAIVRAAAAPFFELAKSRGILFELAIVGEPPGLVGDQRRLEQVVTSLLDNAIKFTPAGGTARLGLAARDEGWELRVEDSGPGVPQNERQAVFEKFNQLKDHLTDKPAGTGLGLATSRAIVARFGGLIWCEDSPLGGAGFVVLLPGLGQPRLAAIGAGTGAGGGF